jgi:hypothetical protein
MLTQGFMLSYHPSSLSITPAQVSRPVPSPSYQASLEKSYSSMSSASLDYSTESLGTQHAEPSVESFSPMGTSNDSTASPVSATEISSVPPQSIQISGAYPQFVDIDFFFRLIERDSSPAYERQKVIYEEHHGQGTFKEALHLAFKHAIIDFKCGFMTDEAKRNEFSEFITYDDRSKTPSHLVFPVFELRKSLQNQSPLEISLWVDRVTHIPVIKSDVVHAGRPQAADSESAVSSLFSRELSNGQSS